jgi:hypothetical protein
MSRQPVFVRLIAHREGDRVVLGVLPMTAWSTCRSTTRMSISV